jgi:hypothetical protein
MFLWIKPISAFINQICAFHVFWIEMVDPFPAYISNTSYILFFSLRIPPENFPGIYTVMLSLVRSLYTYIHKYMYIRYAQSFYLLRKTSLEAQKISSRARHVYLWYLRDKTHVGLCKRLQVSTASTEPILGLVSLFISRGALTSVNVKEGSSMSVEILFGMRRM